MSFQPQAITHFEYSSYNLDIDQGSLELQYALIGNTKKYTFTERISLAGGKYSEEVTQVADRLARLIFLAAGLSYYKAAAPAKVVIKPAATLQEKEFLAALIKNGLTEFAYINNLPQALKPEIDLTHKIKIEPVHLPPNPQAQPFVAIGGGKDSIVSLEALRFAGYKPYLFSVNSYEPIQRTVDRATLSYTQAGRRISPELIALNAEGALNGHVPVTAINSLIALLAAVLTNNRAVVFSNERSASVGNTLWKGIEVNHQWSKSMAFEILLQDILRDVISPDIAYFSLLRPFSELRIARQFAKLTNYHDVFTSCNRAFRLDAAKRQSWCSHCDKCRFVFLILAPYLSQDRLQTIFHKNLLNDGEQLEGFRELLGIKGHKPLECVGEIEESRTALLLLSQKVEWQQSSLVSVLLADLPERSMPTAEQQAYVFSTSEHRVPPKFQKVLEFIE